MCISIPLNFYFIFFYGKDTSLLLFYLFLFVGEYLDLLFTNSVFFPQIRLHYIPRYHSFKIDKTLHYSSHLQYYKMEHNWSFLFQYRFKDVVIFSLSCPLSISSFLSFSLLNSHIFLWNIFHIFFIYFYIYILSSQR